MDPVRTNNAGMLSAISTFLTLKKVNVNATTPACICFLKTRKSIQGCNKTHWYAPVLFITLLMHDTSVDFSRVFLRNFIYGQYTMILQIILN